MERSLHFLMMISAYKDVTFSATLEINPYHQQMTEQHAEFGQGILTPWLIVVQYWLEFFGYWLEIAKYLDTLVLS